MRMDWMNVYRVPATCQALRKQQPFLLLPFQLHHHLRLHRFSAHSPWPSLPSMPFSPGPSHPCPLTGSSEPSSFPCPVTQHSSENAAACCRETWSSLGLLGTWLSPGLATRWGGKCLGLPATWNQGAGGWQEDQDDSSAPILQSRVTAKCRGSPGWQGARGC